MEKRLVLPGICFSFALFLFGVLLCYYWLLPKTILFFFHDTQSLGWAPAWTVEQYYSFVTRFALGFGLAFELPVVVLALVHLGLITHKFMVRTRPVRRGPRFRSRHNPHANAGYSDVNCDGASNVPSLRKLHLDFLGD